MSGRALIIALAGALLLACFLVSLALLRADERTRRLRARRTAATAPYRPSTTNRHSASTQASRPHSACARWFARVLGMDAHRPTPYAAPVWLVLLGALLPTFAFRWLMQGLFGPLAWLAAAPFWLLVVRTFYLNSDSRRRATLLKQFPDALAIIVRAVRVGIPVAEAIRAVSRDGSEPTASEFARVHDQLVIGAPIEEALRELARRTTLPEYRFFATTMSLQGQTGGGLSETLENLADVIRKRVALKARGFALAAEARTSAGVLATLPVFSGVALAVLNPEYLAPLFDDGPGRVVLSTAVIWLCLGLLVMRGLIRKSLS